VKAIATRLDKLKTDPARDKTLMSELGPLQTAYVRALSARKGVPDPKLEEFRWLLEELRVSLFAQELKTPMPVSVKRLQKVVGRHRGLTLQRDGIHPTSYRVQRQRHAADGLRANR